MHLCVRRLRRPSGQPVRIFNWDSLMAGGSAARIRRLASQSPTQWGGNQSSRNRAVATNRPLAAAEWGHGGGVVVVDGPDDEQWYRTSESPFQFREHGGCFPTYMYVLLKRHGLRSNDTLLWK